MKNYKDSDYAINRYSDGIVYRFADGNSELTLEKFLKAHPELNEDDFIKWKQWSNSDYEELDREENSKNCNNKTLTENIATPSLEELIFNHQDNEEKRRTDNNKLQVIFLSLTEIQRRRLLLHKIKKLTTREIADLEGVSQRTVEDSLQWADKKIKKIYKKN